MGLFSRFFGRRKSQREQFTPRNIVTFHNTGKQVPLILDVDQFCEMVLKEEECALLLSLRGYKDAALKMMRSFGKQKNPYSFPLICHGCSAELHKSPSFMVGITGFGDAPHIKGTIVMGTDRSKAGKAGRCPECGGDKVLVVYSRERI